ncbi:MAG: glycosyltransferase family 4 protein, partial [Cyclobacteriaceae bacterium]
GVYLQNLIPALSEAFQLTLIGNKEELKHYAAEVIHTEIPIYSIAEMISFPRLIPDCDVFWSPHYNVPLLPIKARKRLVTIHDVYHLAYFHTLSLKQKLYAKVMMQAAVKGSDHIITVSAFSRDEIVKYTGISSDKITVIHNGIDHALFRSILDVDLLQKVRQKYQLPDKFLLFVGNVKPHKNLLALMNAFDQIRDQIPDHSLLIVGKKEGFITGDTSIYKRIRQNSELESRISFTGFIDNEDLPVVYSMSDLFVFPSLYEGFGFPPLEAMACGCPVLVSDRASMPEACGDAAAYVNPEDTEAMGNAILNMLTMNEVEKENRVKKGIKRADCFTWEQSLQKHIELIRNL